MPNGAPPIAAGVGALHMHPSSDKHVPVHLSQALLSLPVRALHHLELMGALRPLRWVAAAAVLASSAVWLGAAVRARQQQQQLMAAARCLQGVLMARLGWGLHVPDVLHVRATR
jgi:hypothetical protein